MSDYKDFGFTTSNPVHTHSYLFKPVSELLSEKKNRTILDVGCGNGWLTNDLIEGGFNVYGTDASVSGIEIAKRKNKDRFFVQDLTTDDLPSELQDIPFDTIISTEVIEHLYSPHNYINFCKKILLRSGGGELIMSTPYHGYLKNVLLAVTDKMDKHYTSLHDGLHIKFWSKKTLSKLMQDKGFSNLKFIGCGRLPYLWKSMIISGSI